MSGPARGLTLYGVTIDNANDGGIADQAAAIFTIYGDTGFPLAVRVVFDEGTAGADWVDSVEALRSGAPASSVMGMLLDSTEIPTLNVTQYGDRATDFLGALGDNVDVWEIGNEVNGSWTGDPADVAAKVLAAFNVFNGAGKAMALTVYYNPNGVDGAEPTPQDWVDTYLDDAVKAGVGQLLISYYEVDFDNYRPDAATVQALVEDMHARFPSAWVGFGEVGLDDAVDGGTLAQAADIMAYYYALDIPLSYYAAGYFWWYGGEDVLGSGATMLSDFEAALNSIPGGDGGGSAPVVGSVSPTSGTSAGGTSVVVAGSLLTGATAVTFGATDAASFTVDSDSQITAVSPAHAAGTVAIVVTTPDGSSG